MSNSTNQNNGVKNNASQNNNMNSNYTMPQNSGMAPSYTAYGIRNICSGEEIHAEKNDVNHFWFWMKCI